jgi:hypothetical protein
VSRLGRLRDLLDDLLEELGLWRCVVAFASCALQATTRATLAPRPTANDRSPRVSAKDFEH